MSNIFTRLLIAAALLLPTAAISAELVVIDSYGMDLKPGAILDGTKPITLNAGQRLTLIGPDGRRVTLNGKFYGLAMSESTLASDPELALAALISARNARMNSLAVARSVAPAAALSAPTVASSAKLVVIDSYGMNFRPGAVLDGTKPITLNAGQRLTLISPDGRSVTLNGKFYGLAMPASSLASDPKQALAALISTRNARSNTIAAIRSGATAAALPDPWLIDISRPGQRCVREGEPQIWWRPATDVVEDFMVFPLDKSWTAALTWDEGTDRMEAPQLWQFDTESLYIVKTGPQEDAITVNIIPKSVGGELMMTSWMLEKGCTQQADAFLRRIGQEHGGDTVVTVVTN